MPNNTFNKRIKNSFQENFIKHKTIIRFDFLQFLNHREIAKLAFVSLEFHKTIDPNTYINITESI